MNLFPFLNLFMMIFFCPAYDDSDGIESFLFCSLIEVGFSGTENDSVRRAQTGIRNKFMCLQIFIAFFLEKEKK